MAEIKGTTQNDTLNGTDNDDILRGYAGDDLFSAGYGYDTIDGGDGFDTVDMRFYNGEVRVDLASGRVKFPGDGADLYETWTSIEGVRLGNGNDTIIGSDASEYLVADANDSSTNNGNDTVYGGGGDDVIDGGWGFDYLDGQAGQDTVDYTFFSDSSGTTYDMEKGIVYFTPTYSAGDNHDVIVNFENLIAGGGDDAVIGTEQANIITGGKGDDTVYAKGGTDTFVVNDTRAQILVESNEDGSIFIMSADGNDLLNSVERIQTNDATLAMSNDPVADQAYRIYKAAFDRIPDETGLGYWIRQMDQGMTVEEVAARFMISDEFSSLYGRDVSDQHLVTALYENTLGREPDQDGFAYWEEQMAQGLSDVEVFTLFSESEENQNNVRPMIDDGIWFV